MYTWLKEVAIFHLRNNKKKKELQATWLLWETTVKLQFWWIFLLTLEFLELLKKFSNFLFYFLYLTNVANFIVLSYNILIQLIQILFLETLTIKIMRSVAHSVTHALSADFCKCLIIMIIIFWKISLDLTSFWNSVSFERHFKIKKQ